MNIQSWFKNIAPKCPRGVALVTGSSRGIGAQLVKELAKNGFAVLPTARSDVKVESENENIFQTLRLDVTNEKSILELAVLLKTSEIKINLMVHNAGIGPNKDANALSLDTSILNLIYETNVFGLIETNNKLQNCYGTNATIAMISSIMGHTSLDNYNLAAYRLSKRTVIQYAQQVALQCKAENKKWTVLSFHPGSVMTEMNPSGKISTQKCAQNIIKLFSKEMSEKLIGNNGGFWSFDETIQEWKLLSVC